MKPSYKIIIPILFFLMVISSAAFAKEVQLSNEYVHSALWINTNDNNRFYSVSPSFEFPQNTVRTQYLWTPYQGENPLTKEEFFTIAGMEETSLQYHQSKQTANTLRKTSFGMILTGTLLLLGYGALNLDNNAIIYSSLGLILGGITIGGVSIKLVINSNATFSAENAAKAAASYNETLKKELGIL
ncbi:hypothetical protein [uncultured Sphaerochaeta sp.]|uniref:hypothetical protein n=1 Tax=uncultured Sphaerochaeta sp. TaxID=886478 RepID=UPI002A0A5DBF|nr:hypothetical protein [uncultured Sphaerochaeta sp.]